MRNTMKKFAAFLTCMMLVIASAASAADKKEMLKPDEAKAKQAYALGVSAYIWGYPMVIMKTRTRDLMTKGGDAPVTPALSTKAVSCLRP